MASKNIIFRKKLQTSKVRYFLLAFYKVIQTERKMDSRNSTWIVATLMVFGCAGRYLDISWFLIYTKQ